MEHKSLYEGVIEDDAYSVKAEFEKLLYEKFDKFVEELELFENDNLSLDDIFDIIKEVAEDIEEDSSELFEIEDTTIALSFYEEASANEFAKWLDDQDFITDYEIEHDEEAELYIVGVEVEEPLNEGTMLKKSVDADDNTKKSKVCDTQGMKMVDGQCMDKKKIVNHKLSQALKNTRKAKSAVVNFIRAMHNRGKHKLKNLKRKKKK
jgi:hypothetical protein